MILSEGINHGKLQSIIVGELKKVGLKHRLKKIILKSIKDNKTLFGAPLFKVPSCSVICCGSTLSIPVVVSEMSSVLRANAHIEGLFRKAGSQTRQKDIKRLLDAGGCVSEGHHPIDVASVLKLFLRNLPEPLISAEVQDLLLRCRVSAGDDALKSILHTLLLLPVLHVHLLHYITELLKFISSKHKDNLMDTSNLAIVMAPSIMPLPATASAQRLEHHVALVKIFIENSEQIGILTDELMSQLDDDSVCHAKRKKRRSGSLNRVLNGLRKMVSSSVHTPAAVRDNARTPILSKSAAKRKFDSYEGISTKKKKDIKKNLPQKELTFTPMKLGLERKRLRLSLVDARSTPIINSDFSSHINSETSISSEDMLTSTEHLFSAHDTIDLSDDMKNNKNYVRIPKHEYEEIKNRVSAIENRLSREFTEVTPGVLEPLQHVQNAYEQTLEDVAMLKCPNSDTLARRLSKELKIRPNEEAKVIRSPSARKIGSIRRRSKENIIKIVRHKSWNASTQSSHNADRFYPYMGLTRERTSTTNSDLIAPKIKKSNIKDRDKSPSDNSTCYMSNYTNSDLKYRLRKRTSIGSDCNLNKTIGRPQARRSLNITNNNSYDGATSDNSTLDLSEKSNNSVNKLLHYQNIPAKSLNRRSPSQQKWRNAAAFFMDKTGEVDSSCNSGRPSVNKLRRQNVGAVLAKAKFFETSSDRSSERKEKLLVHTGFARRPRVNGQNALRAQKTVSARAEDNIAPTVPSKMSRNTPPAVPLRTNRHYLNVQNKQDAEICRSKKSSPGKQVTSPQANGVTTPNTPAMKKPLCPPRNLRTPLSNTESRRINTPMKAVHISPRRQSPRQKMNHYI